MQLLRYVFGFGNNRVYFPVSIEQTATQSKDALKLYYEWFSQIKSLENRVRECLVTFLQNNAYVSL